MHKFLICFPCVLMLAACGTYFDPNDPYIRGIRWFDRQQFETARLQWEPLAEAGDCDAQYRLGTLYFLGADVPQSYSIAHKWWLSAANQGQAFAQALLSTMYAHDVMSIRTVQTVTSFQCEKGCGYDKDMVEAYKWMRLAERFTPYETGRTHAHYLTEKYKESLTAEQLAEAGHYVETWEPSPAQCKQRKIS